MMSIVKEETVKSVKRSGGRPQSEVSTSNLRQTMQM